jgi:hypothetical protein
LEMRVGNVLVKQDFISEEMLQRALTIQKRTNQKIGEILIGMGLVGEDTIKESLKTQAVEVVLSLFKWKKGEYNFKIMDHLDRTMKMIDPIPTDNLIMEGVQMLDEWPLIKKLIPDEEPHGQGEAKIFLSETEANLLKYINGRNAVIELVELGVFTEYKVYKSLYNLINKKIIKVKAKAVEQEGKEERMPTDFIRVSSKVNINRLYYVFLILLLLIFIFTFSKPMEPFKSGKVIMKTELYKDIFPGPPHKESPEKDEKK